MAFAPHWRRKSQGLRDARKTSNRRERFAHFSVGSGDLSQNAGEPASQRLLYLEGISKLARRASEGFTIIECPTLAGAF